MKIEISKTQGALLATQPHFWQVHDQHLREHEGEDAYELPLQEIVNYIQSQPANAILREAVQRIVGSHGLHTNFTAIEAGETRLDKCFLIATDEAGNTHWCVHGDWVEVQPQVLAQLLGSTQGHSNPVHAEEIKQIRQHQTELSKLVGLEPNSDRIQAEFGRKKR